MPKIQHFLTLAVLLSIALPALAQSADCPPSAIIAGQAPFSGVIASWVPGDGARALRPELATTYYLAFDGSNFTAGGAVSPDGRYYAVPNGVIQTNSSADVRYVVQELRVITTETVPRIAARVPWQASFPVGTRFATTQGIPVIQWLDGETFAFPSGSMNGEQVWQRVAPFSQPTTVEDFPAAAASPLSPDGRQGLRPDGLGWAIYEPSTGGETARLPRLSAAQTRVWSPDSAHLAAVVDSPDGTALALFSADGAPVADVQAAEPGQQVWNVRWSPDGARLAYALFDPETELNHLFIYDLTSGETQGTCIDLVTHPQALAWSPDSAQMALVADVGGEALWLFDPAAGTLQRLGNSSGGLLGWFDGQ
ncbi:MAG: hypothetical protein MUF38_02180 [Anaerolineae bacterium]|nr:hypothetical protein [Anaerolineae bacterium]